MPHIDKRLLNYAIAQDEAYLSDYPDLWAHCPTHIDEEIELAVADRLFKTVQQFLSWQEHTNT